MDSAPNFNDPKAWSVVKNVAVFDVHADKNKDGKVVRKFTREDLEEIAKRCNEREAKGQLCPLSIGHTRDDAPEDEQPELVGYARNFQVRYDDKLKRYTIRADYYLRSDRAQEARTYPRTSVEYWPDDKVFDPIALIRRTPRRDLGQWTYGRTVVKHAKTAAARNVRPVRYAMGDADEAEELEEKTPKKPDPTDDPDSATETDRDDEVDSNAADDEVESDGPEGGYPKGVEPEFHDKVMKCMKHGYRTGVFDDDHRKMYAKYQAEGTGGEGGSEGGSEGGEGGEAAAVLPGETNALPKKDDEEPDNDNLGAEKMSKTASGSAGAELTLKMRKLEVENKNLKKENERLKADNRHNERRFALEKFVRAGVIMDIEQEMRDWQDAPHDAWIKQCQRYAHNYEKDPTAADIIITADETNGVVGDEPTKAQSEAALKYMRSNGLTGPNAFKDALAAITRIRR